MKTLLTILILAVGSITASAQTDSATCFCIDSPCCLLGCCLGDNCCADADCCAEGCYDDADCCCNTGACCAD